MRSSASLLTVDPTHAVIFRPGTRKISFRGSSDAKLHCVDRDCSSEVIEMRPIRLLLNFVIMKFK